MILKRMVIQNTQEGSGCLLEVRSGVPEKTCQWGVPKPRYVCKVIWEDTLLPACVCAL